jgi:hypothetical protein
MSIDTLANVKTRLGISTSADDALLDLLRNSADLWVTNQCGRDFGGGTYTEYHPGGSPFVHLRNFPVQAVTSVNVDPGYVFGSSTVWAATAYVVHLERGVIQSLIGPFPPPEQRTGFVDWFVNTWPRGPRIIQVVYTVTSSAIADDVLEAYAQLVGHWYRRVKTQTVANWQNVTAVRLGDARTDYGPDQISGLPIPPDVYHLLAPYRIPNI